MKDLEFLNEYLDKEFYEALKNLENISGEITEIRIRRNKNVVVVQKGTSRMLYSKDKAVFVDDNRFDEIFLKMCDYSVYSNEENLKKTGKDTVWLQKQLKEQGFHNSGEIYLGSVNTVENTLVLYPFENKCRDFDPFE